jgi:hypothetical protein
MIVSEGQMLSSVFSSGTRIVVGDGPLEGVRGTVLGLDADHRLIVALTLRRGLLGVRIDPQMVLIDTELAAAPLVVH